ncbi:pyrimidine dimer DNA glycosylase/endonuclease V [Parvularcula oceani]|uniref:pyrimidine dimer DNA glycosylase/endonuclease V n=1 Tax=Parvularcula oceani TaxID=1247963 RepID=UPI00068FDD26|nr:pyrimidine dimer DNA glycosylase/endonuclease V [Parvularcula oceani]
MNIFHLSPDPRANARLHCDKHVGKMLVENVQMLSTALVLSGGEAPWKPAFQNHPMNKWVRESAGNFAWTWDLSDALGEEYVHRFAKTHKAHEALRTFDRDALERLIGPGQRTTPPQCMGEEFKVSGDTIAAYRRFYAGEKARFATYTGRPVPDFMMDAFLPMTQDEIDAAARSEG